MTAPPQDGGAPVYVDTHVHLDDRRYDVDRAAMMARARAAGVRTFVSVGTDVDDSAWAVAAAAADPDIFAVVGRHPERAVEMGPDDLRKFRALLKAPGVVAVGEVGLDYHRPDHDARAQQRVLGEMLGLAREAGLPLVVHVRGAFEPLFEVLRRDWDPRLGGVFHCFSGDAVQARQALDLNFDLALGGVLTFKNAAPLRELAAGLPLDRLVLETDGPWLAPQAWRGGRNEPAYLPNVAALLAELKGLRLDEVARATTSNARRLFRLDSRAGGGAVPPLQARTS